MWLRPASATCDFCISHGTVPTHVVTLTQVGTSVYLGQTHLGTPSSCLGQKVFTWVNWRSNFFTDYYSKQQKFEH